MPNDPSSDVPADMAGKITIGQAAELLGVSVDTIRRWEEAGKISTQRSNGGHRLFNRDELLQFSADRPLTTSQAAAILGTSASKLRSLDKQGLINPPRNEKGNRLYTKELIAKYQAQQNPSQPSFIPTPPAPPTSRLPLHAPRSLSVVGVLSTAVVAASLLLVTLLASRFLPLPALPREAPQERSGEGEHELIPPHLPSTPTSAEAETPPQKGGENHGVVAALRDLVTNPEPFDTAQGKPPTSSDSPAAQQGEPRHPTVAGIILTNNSATPIYLKTNPQSYEVELYSDGTRFQINDHTHPVFSVTSDKLVRTHPGSTLLIQGAIKDVNQSTGNPGAVLTAQGNNSPPLWQNLADVTVGALLCDDCLTDEQIKDIYLYNDRDDTFAGNLTITRNLTTDGTLTIHGATTLANPLTLNNITYAFPDADGSSNYVLSTDGAGNLTWTSVGSATVTADSLDFIHFEDTLDLDAATEINLGTTNLTIDLDSTGDFVIKDAGTAVHIFNDSGNVGIGTTTPGGSLVVASGNVGIGTTNPDTKLKLVGGRAYFEAVSEPYNLYLQYNAATTGMFLGGSSAGHLQVSDANGVARVTVQSAGNVGINTTAPAYLLDVNGTANFTGAVTFGSSSSPTSNANITITKADPSLILNTTTATDTDFWLSVTEDAGGDDDDLFQIGDGTTPGTNPHFTINTSGNVGIGTTAPGTKLSVTQGTSFINIGELGGGSTFGGIAFGSSSANPATGTYSMIGNGTDTIINRGTGGAIYFRENNATQMQIATGGVVTMSNSLFVTNAGTTTLYVRDLTNGVDLVNYAYSGGGLFGTFTNHNLSIRTNNTDRMTFDTSGNVGINTTAPGYTLDVNGTANFTGAVTFGSSSSPTSNANITITKADPSIILNTTTATDTDFWLGIQEDAGGDDDDLFQIGDGTTPGTNPHFTINTSGNVGIGTTAPGDKLTVIGDLSLGAGANPSTSTVRFAGDSMRIEGSRSGGGSGFNFVRWVTGSTYSTDMVLDASGNLGIGTTVPGTTLDIRAATASQQMLSTTTTNAVYTSFRNEASNGGYLYVGKESSTGSGILSGTTAYAGLVGTYGTTAPLEFATNGTVRMGITATGLINLTTTASSGTHLNVTGTNTGSQINSVSSATSATNYGISAGAQGSGATLNVGGYFYALNGTTNYALQIPVGFPPAGANNYAIYSDNLAKSYFAGNVGIGHTTPAGALTVNGNVGIGTTAPEQKLHILGSAMRLTDGNAGGELVSGSNRIYLLLDQNAGSGIGVGGDYLLLDRNGTDGTLANNGGDLILQAYAAQSIIFKTGAGETPRMRVDSAGNVGIGTTAPGYLLEVAGTLGATGNTTLGDATSDTITLTGSLASDITFTPNSTSRSISLPMGNGLGGNLTLGAGSSNSFDGGNLILNAGLGAVTNGLVQLGNANTSAVQSVANFSTLSNTTLGDATVDTITYTGRITGNVGFTSASSHTISIAAGSGTGHLTIAAQDTNDQASGGNLILNAGDGTSTDGLVKIGETNTSLISITPNTVIGGTDAGTSCVKCLAITGSTAPSASITDGIQLFAVDIAGSHELRVRDEAGNVTTLSPHNFSLFQPEQDYYLPWTYTSERDNQAINVDMYGAIQQIELLSGQHFIYGKNLENGDTFTPTTLAGILSVPEAFEELDVQLASLVDQVIRDQSRVTSLDERLTALEDISDQTPDTSPGDSVLVTGDSAVVPGDSPAPRSSESEVGLLVTGDSSLPTTLDLESLTIKGDATIYGTLLADTLEVATALNLHGDATIWGKLLVKSDVEIEGNAKVAGTLTVSSQQAGAVTVPENATEVAITFKKPFSAAPHVLITPEGLPAVLAGSFPQYIISKKSADGFTIQLTEPSRSQFVFSWLAVPIEGADTSKVEITTQELTPSAEEPSSAPEEPTAPVAEEPQPSPAPQSEARPDGRPTPETTPPSSLELPTIPQS